MSMLAIGLAVGLVLLLALAVRPLPSGRGRTGTSRTAAQRRRREVVTAGSGVVLVAIVAGWMVALAGALALVVAHRWRRIRHARHAARAVDAGLPDAIELIVLAVRSGRLPAAAMAGLRDHWPTAIAPAFVELDRRIARGQRFADALAALPELLGPPAQALADSFAAADRYGLPLAPVLDRLADAARAHRRRLADARMRQLPVQLSIPLVLCTLPAYVLLAIVPLLLGAFSSLHH